MCEGCERKFKEEAYLKHSKVCEKVFQGQRIAIDSKKKKINDLDQAVLKHKEYEDKKKGKNQKSKGQKWKKQSEEFRAIIKQNREFDQKGGTGVFTHIPSAITDDYTLCDMCNRKYNEQAYTKHLPTCERRSKEAQMKGKAKQSGPTSNISSKPNLNVRFKK